MELCSSRYLIQGCNIFPKKKLQDFSVGGKGPETFFAPETNKSHFHGTQPSPSSLLQFTIVHITKHWMDQTQGALAAASDVVTKRYAALLYVLGTLRSLLVTMWHRQLGKRSCFLSPHGKCTFGKTQLSTKYN